MLPKEMVKRLANHGLAIRAVAKAKAKRIQDIAELAMLNASTEAYTAIEMKYHQSVATALIECGLTYEEYNILLKDRSGHRQGYIHELYV